MWKSGAMCGPEPCCQVEIDHTVRGSGNILRNSYQLLTGLYDSA
jgi:hypothetical protein